MVYYIIHHITGKVDGYSLQVKTREAFLKLLRIALDWAMVYNRKKQSRMIVHQR